MFCSTKSLRHRRNRTKNTFLGMGKMADNFEIIFIPFPNIINVQLLLQVAQLLMGKEFLCKFSA